MTDARGKIKKLTADKIRDNLTQITRKNGDIDLAGRGIETILSLDGLQRATKLDLSRNKLTKLSDLKRVQGLTMLKLTDNRLNGEGLAELQHLKKLVILNVAENQVARIPVEVLRNLRTLKALVLNNNSITTLEWLPKLPELNSLIVSHNRITEIPPRLIERLPTLTKISISHNLLEELPDLSALAGVTELRLSHNKIKKLPRSLAKLQNLRVLELGHNAIDEWEGVEALSQLEGLKQLNLSGNPIVGQPLPVAADTKPSKKKEKKTKDASGAGDESDGGSEGGDNDDDDDAAELELSAEAKRERKEAKRLDAKHKQYNFKIKRLFPKLVIRDGQRVLDKRTHGYVAPPKEDKPKPEKRKLAKRDTKTDTGDKRSKEPKLKKRRTEEPSGAPHGAPAATSEALESVPQSVSKAAKVAKAVASSPSPVPGKEPKEPHETEAKKAAPTKDEEKTKKQKQKPGKDEKKKTKQRQPKDLSSGVVAVKQFKKAKQSKGGAEQKVDLSKVSFTPSVGMGGSSAWD